MVKSCGVGIVELCVVNIVESPVQTFSSCVLVSVVKSCGVGVVWSEYCQVLYSGYRLFYRALLQKRPQVVCK